MAFFAYTTCGNYYNRIINTVEGLNPNVTDYLLKPFDFVVFKAITKVKPRKEKNRNKIKPEIKIIFLNAEKAGENFILRDRLY